MLTGKIITINWLTGIALFQPPARGYQLKVYLTLSQRWKLWTKQSYEFNKMY